MKRMKEAWDDIYENTIMSAQTLRMNQLEVKKTLRRMKTMRKKSLKISTKRKMEKLEL